LLEEFQVGSIFDYQGSRFETEESLNSIASAIENVEEHSCPEVQHLCGLPCFKHGAAYDKMGYYSLFLNVFFPSITRFWL
jgi:hypothetical protein